MHLAYRDIASARRLNNRRIFSDISVLSPFTRLNEIHGAMNTLMTPELSHTLLHEIPRRGVPGILLIAVEH